MGKALSLYFHSCGICLAAARCPLEGIGPLLLSRRFSAGKCPNEGLVLSQTRGNQHLPDKVFTKCEHEAIICIYIRPKLLTIFVCLITLIMNHYRQLFVLVIFFLIASISCNKAPEEIPVSSVSLNKTSLELVIGESVQLNATANPSDATQKTVTWSSSNQAVATVAGGKVTAVSEGSSIITANAGGKSATCSVTVKKKTVDVTSVVLNKTDLSLTEGDTETLVATVKPDDATDKAVTWSTSKSDVATVENGKVVAIKEGEAVISAKAGEKSATCKVIVNKKVIAVSSVELNKNTIELVEGESETLVATVNPDDATDKTVTWSSSDESIVIVENGKVSAIKEGSATITAAAGDIEATCTVTVKKKVIVVSSITLNKSSINILVGGNETLIATVLPDNATDKTVIWSSKDERVATVKDGKVTAISIGKTTISAKADNITAECTVIVTNSSAGGNEGIGYDE